MTYHIATSSDDDDSLIEELDLSVRPYNCLKRSGIHTVKQIFALSKRELLGIRNLGRAGYEEVREHLFAHGFMDRAHPRAPFTTDDEPTE